MFQKSPGVEAHRKINEMSQLSAYEASVANLDTTAKSKFAPENISTLVLDIAFPFVTK